MKQEESKTKHTEGRGKGKEKKKLTLAARTWEMSQRSKKFGILINFFFFCFPYFTL